MANEQGWATGVWTNIRGKMKKQFNLEKKKASTGTALFLAELCEKPLTTLLFNEKRQFFMSRIVESSIRASLNDVILASLDDFLFERP